jgi:large subunit ribosomal protein L19
MSVDPKEPSSKEVKVEDETKAPEASGVKNASKSKSTGKTISNKKLSPAEIIKTFEEAQQNKKLPEIYVGDTVRVGVRISEGNKERVQPYEGVVIAKRHGGINKTITVRRIFQGIGVERIFLVHSPQVASIKVERRGKVRRAKLFYLRERVGKATRVKQRFDR